MKKILLAAALIPGALLPVPIPAGDDPLPRISTFRCDATPPPGEPLLWAVPLVKAEDPLWAKGIVLERGKDRFVLCALDWCLLCNDSERDFRERIAAAVDTSPERVAVQCVHQHAAPYADRNAHRLLEKVPEPPIHLSDRFLEDVLDRLARAAKDSLAGLEPFDRVGTGQARVERVASARRLKGADGKIVVRYSGGGSNPVLAAAPEGDIDPALRTITLARGEKPLVRLHYYATHPQTFCCDGRASADFVGKARERLEEKQKVFQVYFTGCGSDVTAGKYNDGSPQAREGLAERLLTGMEDSCAATRFSPVGNIVWRTAGVSLPPRTEPGFLEQDLRKKLADAKAGSGSRVYEGAMALAFLGRADRPVGLSALEIGPATIVHLPGEPMLEYQLFARRERPDRFVAVAGYGDCGPGYICTDAAFAEGGYEPSAANVGKGAEGVLKEAIRKLLKS